LKRFPLPVFQQAQLFQPFPFLPSQQSFPVQPFRRLLIRRSFPLDGLCHSGECADSMQIA
jgi:hypothetical protein